MMNKLLRLASIAPLAILPQKTLAKMPVSGFQFGGLTVPDLVQNVTGVLMGSAAIVCMAVFAAGAFFYIISAGDEQRKGLGKGMMVGAVIGTIVIVGAMGIMNTVMFFVYGP